MRAPFLLMIAGLAEDVADMHARLLKAGLPVDYMRVLHSRMVAGCDSLLAISWGDDVSVDHTPGLLHLIQECVGDFRNRYHQQTFVAKEGERNQYIDLPLFERIE